MVKSIKVTMIGSLPPLMGISPYCRDLFNSLDKKIDIDFINFKKIYPEFLYPGKTTKRLDFYKKNNVKNIISWNNPFSWVKAGLSVKGKIAHVQWWSYVLAPIYFTFLIILKIRRKKIVMTLHNITPHEKNLINNFFNKLIFSFANHFIVHSISNKKKLIDDFKVNKTKISVIPHGTITLSEFRNISKKEAREKLGLKENKKILLFFGFIRSYKGLDILLKSLVRISKEIDNIKLIIAGECWKNWKYYEDLIKKNNLDKFVLKYNEFIPTEKIEYFFSASDLVVLPYKHFDSQSGVGSLALYYRKPQIVSDVGGLVDFVDDERAIVKHEDIDDLAYKIINICNNESLIIKLKNDSQKLSKKFDWNKISDMTIKVYEKVLQ